MSTNLTNSTSQVSLASYGTGNPFYVDNGTAIVSTGTGQTAVYGDASQAWTLSNAGTVAGAVGGSVTGDGGDSGYGDGSGFAGGFGIDVSGSLTLTNSGEIAGGKGGGGGAAQYHGGSGGVGVSIGGGGTITNMAGASIVGAAGSYGRLGAGGGGSGVVIGGFGTVANQAGAVIAGGTGGFAGYPSYGGTGGAGIMLTSGGSVTNAGTIVGGAPGYLYHGVYPGDDGVQVLGSADSTISNSGTISGGGGHAKAVQFNSGNDRLILYSGSVLSGGADGGSGSNVLELADDALPGTVAGIGSTITNFQTLAIDSGAQWTATDATLDGVSRLTVDGSLTLAAKHGSQLSQAIVGRGTLTLQGGVTAIADDATCKVANLALSDSAVVNVDENLAYTGKLTEAAGTRITVRTGQMLAISGTIAGSGAIDIGVGSTLRIAGVAGAAESVAFGANTGKLTLINPKRFRAAITHFVAGDKIDIANANFAFNKNETLTFVENAKKTEGTLTLKNGADVVALHLFGQHVAQGFHIAGDGHGGTMITYKQPAAHAMDHLASGGGG